MGGGGGGGFSKSVVSKISGQKSVPITEKGKKKKNSISVKF